jgi:hypothetical protein
MSISKKDIKLLLYVAGIAVAVLVYFLIFQSTMEKVDALEIENSSLTAQYQQLQILDANKEQYQRDTKQANTDISAYLSHFPVYMQEEDSIMYAVDLENMTDISINNINFSQEEQLYAATLPASSSAVKVSEDTTDDVSIYLYNMNSLYSFTCTYDGFKEALASIQQDSDIKNVDSLSLAYDSDSGLLVGTMSVNMYFVDGRGIAYEEPYIPSMSIGVNNIFGATSSMDSEAAETSEETEDAESEDAE